MANLALGKKPLENTWMNPHYATDGISDNYDVSRDYTSSIFPAPFTLKLSGVSSISVIRFLLWDGLGKGAVTPEKRSRRLYRYELQLSSDGENFITWYDTEKNGYNGWQIFTFEPNVPAMYVRLFCKHHNENDHFHIIEFEVHDDIPAELDAWRIGCREKLKEPFKTKDVDSLISRNEKQLEELKGKYAQEIENVNKVKLAFDSAIKQVDLFNKNLAFDEMAKKHNGQARGWLIAGIMGLFIFLICVYLLFIKKIEDIRTFTEIYNEVPQIISKDGSSQINPTLYFEFAKIISFKILILSIVGFIVSFFFKSYRSEKHNYIVNKQKAVALAATLKLSDDFRDENSRLVMKDFYNIAIQSLFQQPNSGYLHQDSENVTTVVNNIAEKVKLS